MRLGISCQWVAAPTVRTPELGATWANIEIRVGDTALTLLKEKSSPSQVREHVTVSAYPLAEWIALNWWSLETSSHRPSYEGLSLRAAGEGFPWPDLTLRSDRQQMWLSASPLNDPNDRVQFLSSLESVVSAQEARYALSRFVDATVRRLEDSGITATLLQDEWAAVQASSEDERSFALVAAAWGYDPYDISAHVADLLIKSAELLRNDQMVADLARAVELDALPKADEWVRQAVEELTLEPDIRKREISLAPLLTADGIVPWREGYQRARNLRGQLGIEDIEAVPLNEFVTTAQVDSVPPGRIPALARLALGRPSGAVGPYIEPESNSGRFIGARSLARQITDPGTRYSLITQNNRFTDKFERAFAAEFLAPAKGIEKFLNGDFSEDAQAVAAEAYGVSPLVVAYQVDNQIAA